VNSGTHPCLAEGQAGSARALSGLAKKKKRQRFLAEDETAGLHASKKKSTRMRSRTRVTLSAFFCPKVWQEEKSERRR